MVALFIYHQHIQAHAPKLLSRMTVQRFRSRIRFQNPALHGVNDPHGLRMFLEQQPELWIFFQD